MPPRLLIVDDDPLNLEIITEFLDGTGYALTPAHDGETAWRQLTEGEAADGFDLIVLDRNMPDSDGLALLRRIKADSRYARIPVIIQTAASAMEDIREGLQAGAHYYLTKPYERDTLLVVVRTALEVAVHHKVGDDGTGKAIAALPNEGETEFACRTLDEATRLANQLARLSPRPEAAALGLSELLINAVEHGNLGISYEEKAQLKRTDTWLEEVTRRLALPAYADRQVRVRVAVLPEGMRVTIRDEGSGFDWRRYLEFDPQRAFDPNGRGIAVARLMSFNTLEYQGNGNTVVATILAPFP